MILIDNFKEVLAQLEHERGVSKEILIDTIKAAILSACKKKFTDTDNLEVDLNEINGEMRVIASKKVVETVESTFLEISLAEISQYAPDIKIGDIVKLEVTPDDFGRLAAQTAKQVIIQRIREAEKDGVFGEFKGREGEVITGSMQKIEGRNYIINLGRVEAVLPPTEQIEGEIFSVRDLVKVYLVETRRSPRGPVITVSRTHPGLLKHLFALEIPEINEGVIEIKSAARDPGKRSKIAVKSNDANVGAVGTCVGHMGQRIQAIMRELHNEKIDIIEWSENPKTYITNALKPAKLSKAIVISEDAREAIVVVAEDQLSLAIGRNGQNVRLATRLTGWKIDILSEAEFEEKADEIESIRQDTMTARIAREKQLKKNSEAAAVTEPAAAEPTAELSAENA